MMYGSPSAAAAKELNRPFSVAAAAALGYRREETDLQRQQMMSSGLLRYRSAPSSLLGEVCEDFLPARPSSPDTESMFARILAPDVRGEIRDKAAADGGGCRRDHQFTPPPPEETAGFSSAPLQMLYHCHQQQPQQPTQQQHQQHPPMSDNGYQVVSSMGMDAEQIKAGGTGSSNLIRQSSSPAGLFSHLNVDNGYGLIRGMASGIRNSIGTDPGMAAAAAGRLKRQISFSSRQNSLSQISELGSDGIPAGGGSPEESSNDRCFIPSYAVTSWEESLLSDNCSPGGGSGSGGGLKRARDFTALNQTEVQNGDIRNHHVSRLAHHFSLPKTSSELTAIEKFLQFPDSVPCKIRAKRGCATHPRSIAERVRRTRISERMRKLQELVPNMDKQTNTADMLDLAVDYIKVLQKQVKSLTDSRATCTCSASKTKTYQSKGS